MKDCARYKRLILLSLREELYAGDGEELANHLSQCSACRTDAEKFRHIFALTGLEEGYVLDTDKLLSGTKQAMASPSRTTRMRPWIKRTAAAAVLVLLLTGTVTVILHVMKKDTRTDDALALLEPEFELPDIVLQEVNLASYNRNSDQNMDAVLWEEDFDSAKSLAAYASIPILYQVYDESCPIAERLDCECFRNEKIVSATRDFICIRRTHATDELGVTPSLSPAFFIIHPDGEVAKQFGGDIDEETLLSVLSKYAERGGWIKYREFRKYRKLLEETATAYRKRIFCHVQERIDCFSHDCCKCCVKKAGISEEFERIRMSMESYIEAKHTFARDLVKNGEIDRARLYYRKMLEEFEGMPVEAILRVEMDGLPGHD